MRHVCLCGCHVRRRGDQRACLHAGKLMRSCAMAQDAREMEDAGLGVSVYDPVAAVLACPTCLNTHCPALSDKQPRGPRIIRVHPPFNPNSDSQQTSGNTNSEGDE